MYKCTTEERVKVLEEENVENTNSIYELFNILDEIKERLKCLEDLVIGDNK